MRAAAMAGGVDGYCWELNQLGHLFASGKPWPVQMRSSVIRLKEASDADKLGGGRSQSSLSIIILRRLDCAPCLLSAPAKDEIPPSPHHRYNTNSVGIIHTLH